ncbi:MAG: ferrous iron transport protein B, partial [Clostridiales bacterium]|nr:ferrous iron transport protein B [Clostridiales bacterium]
MNDGNQGIRVGFVGNPNCGKTTLFNAFTGARLKVANWPGVTVERMEGMTSYKGIPIRVIDTPGIYSLSCYTLEEKVTRKCLEDGEVDVIVNVLDASSLERNLYLTLQLLELNIPVILALNMIDIVEERGMEINLPKLSDMLGGISVAAVSARNRSGLKELLSAVVNPNKNPQKIPVVTYTPKIENKISKIQTILKANDKSLDNIRWYAIKYLEHDEKIMTEHPIQLDNLIDQNYEKEIISQKYSRIEEIIKACLVKKEQGAQRTDAADRFLTHPILGVPIFLGIMALVFFLTFTVGDFLKGYFEIALDYVSVFIRQLMIGIHASGWITSLVVDGIIAGVGGILTFLPNIFILFLALAFLEDSGYMARVAYVMNEIMGRVGLSGKAFLPMLLGFGCTVPAVMAARA